MYFNYFTTLDSLTPASQLVDGEYDEVEEELKELDESHDGEAEPQTEHAAWVWDELQQLTTQSHTAISLPIPGSFVIFDLLVHF